MVFRGISTLRRFHICSCRYSGKWFWNLLIRVWATRLGLATCFGKNNCGIGAITTSLSQRLQAYLGRIWATTLMLAGITSSCSLTSSPILFFSHPHSHCFSSGSTSWIISSRGRFLGNGFLEGFLRRYVMVSLSSSEPASDVYSSIKKLFEK